MQKTLNRIRSVIKRTCTIDVFADKINISRTTMYNFLNNQTDIQFNTLEKIIKPLGMDILEGLPDNLKEVDSIMIDGRHKKKDEKHNGKVVVLCFKSSSTAHQGLLLKDKKGNYELKLF